MRVLQKINSSLILDLVVLLRNVCSEKNKNKIKKVFTDFGPDVMLRNGVLPKKVFVWCEYSIQ